MNTERSIWVVGDIHGMLDPLVSLLNTIRCVEYSRSRRTTIVFLGDYIDHGPCSKEVIDALLLFRAEFDCVFLAGNHEDMLLQFLQPEPGMEAYGAAWLQGNGGQATICSFQKCRKTVSTHWMRPSDLSRFSPDDLKLSGVYLGFLHALEYAYSDELRIGKHRLDLCFTHAPLHRVADMVPPVDGDEPDIPIEAQLDTRSRAAFLRLCRQYPMWIERYHIWNRSMARTRYGDRVLVHGHSPTPTLAKAFPHRMGSFRAQDAMPFVIFPEGMEVQARRDGDDIVFDAALSDVIGFDIDTGCVYGDALTALNFSSRRLRRDVRVGVLSVHPGWGQRDNSSTDCRYLRFRDF